MTTQLDRLSDVAREMGTLPAVQADTGAVARVRDDVAKLREAFDDGLSKLAGLGLAKSHSAGSLRKCSGALAKIDAEPAMIADTEARHRPVWPQARETTETHQ